MGCDRMLPEMSVKGRGCGTNWHPQEREETKEARESKDEKEQREETKGSFWRAPSQSTGTFEALINFKGNL